MPDTNVSDNGLREMRQQLEAAEKALAESSERLVNGRGFAALMGLAAENAVSLTKLNSDLWDLVLRNLRLAGRSDVHQLGRRINRIEDKLELVLQEVERLADAETRRP